MTKQDAFALLHQTIESTGKDTATIAMEMAISVRVMIRMLKTCSGAAIVEANNYKPDGEGHKACMDLAYGFLKDAAFFEKEIGWMADREKSQEILDSAHPVPS